MDANKSIAVLPFLNMSPNDNVGYFSDGITEEIINALTKIKGLNVTSRTSSFSFKNTQKNIPEIGKALGVNIILEGSVRLAGQDIRITAQLIEVSQDYHFWSETFDRVFSSSFAIQDEISLHIADRIREHIGHFDIEEQLVEHYDISVDQYKEYLRGRFHLMQLDYDNSIHAIEIFKRVIAFSPKFPHAYLDIHQAYTYMATMGIIPSMEGYLKGQPFLESAIQLNEDLPETLLNLSWISCWQQWDLGKAYEYLNKALSKKPMDNMYLTMANFLTLEDKLDAAMLYIDKALKLAPLSAINIHYKGFILYMQGKYDNALTFFIRSKEIEPKLPFPDVYIGASYLLNGEIEKGVNYFNQLPDDNNGYLAKVGGLALCAIFQNEEIVATEAITKLTTYLTTDSKGAALNFLILCHAQLGNIEIALAYIRQSIDAHFPLVLLLPTEPLAKPLYNHQAFQKTLTQVLKKENKAATYKKYKQSFFTDDALMQYKNKLKRLMNNESIYLDQSLSLRSLANHISLSPNQTSQLLNEGFNQNFSDLVNGYRLEYFKAQLKSNKNNHLTLMALAYESGFKSKTVFYTFFKKKTGSTPSAYLKKRSDL